jgi:murein DD-endopeptidase MepM/ murein hydrolase activator NlpD
MRFALLPLAAACLAAAGCNGGGPGTGGDVKVRSDPAFQAGLKTLEEPRGFKHTVRKGDTLYGLAGKYDVPVAAVIAANPGLNPRDMKVGSAVVIPGAGGGAASSDGSGSAVGPKPGAARTPDRGRLRYPVKGKYRAVGGGNPGAEFPVEAGTTVVCCASGRVVLATADLGGLGPTVMVDHGGGLITMYARLADYAVSTGQNLSRGEPLGRSGALGLLFRVYEGAAPKDPGPYIK